MTDADETPIAVTELAADDELVEQLRAGGKGGDDPLTKRLAAWRDESKP